MKVKELIAELQKLNQESDVWLFNDFPNKSGWEPGVSVISKAEANYLARKKANLKSLPKEGDIALT